MRESKADTGMRGHLAKPRARPKVKLHSLQTVFVQKNLGISYPT